VFRVVGKKNVVGEGFPPQELRKIYQILSVTVLTIQDVACSVGALLFEKCPAAFPRSPVFGTCGGL
jgi:hypothetical protein